jgi:hypothetical protein
LVIGCQQRGIAAFFDVAFQVLHFSCPSRLEPRYKEGCVWRPADGGNSAVIKTQIVRLPLDGSR